MVGLRREKSLLGLCVAVGISLSPNPRLLLPTSLSPHLNKTPTQCQNPTQMDRTYHVYLMASQSGVLYLGVTSHLSKRAFQHQQKLLPGFTKKYNVTKLVWFEPHSTARAAISREKEIKKWRRSKKITLIESLNPTWTELSPTL
jgi:putative endonuclease